MHGGTRRTSGGTTLTGAAPLDRHELADSKLGARAETSHVSTPRRVHDAIWAPDRREDYRRSPAKERR